MIGALKGTIYSKSQNSVIVFTGGVGYFVHVTNSFLEESKIESETFLFIHSHIREDAFDLFGFPNQNELRLFELLITVSGVGPKTALLVMDKGADNVEQAIHSSDVEFFTAIPRLGKKNAQKIIIELKSKLGSLTDLDLSKPQESETKEILDALTSLGFIKQEIIRVIQTIPENINTLDEKIRYCLKYLGKR